jgi:hypothetical protein
MESLLKKLDYAGLFDETCDLVTNFEMILDYYVLYNTHTVYYFNKGRKSIHSSILDQIKYTHPDYGSGYLALHGYRVFNDIYDKIDQFTSKYVLPINESDIEIFQQLYIEFMYIKRINDKNAEYISDIITNINNDYTECKKKFSVVPFKGNLPLEDFYNNKEDIYRQYESDYFYSNKNESCTIL